MILVVGGAFSGKHEFAKDKWPDLPVYELEELLKTESDVTDFKEGIYISDLIGCGIVPVDAKMRKMREDVGRLQTLCAKKAAEVYLVTAGIGQKIK